MFTVDSEVQFAGTPNHLPFFQRRPSNFPCLMLAEPNPERSEATRMRSAKPQPMRRVSGAIMIGL
jgi:hypothetical protein